MLFLDEVDQVFEELLNITEDAELALVMAVCEALDYFDTEMILPDELNVELSDFEEERID